MRYTTNQLGQSGAEVLFLFCHEALIHFYLLANRSADSTNQNRIENRQGSDDVTHSVRIDTFLDVSCRLIYEHQCSGGTSFFDSRIAVTQSDSAITTITCDRLFWFFDQIQDTQWLNIS
ncbi:uncharacterized protein LOC111265574 [Varroa jacobsoni]|uniref:uncharacterized protein LOC111265574 n=1 Tax=Varroa jacobsoni TaxID=62625 RepID=UPI000BF7C8A9|nr:uncharacterized protein LOC111265574 [Varroa jacobsoni]